MASGSVTAAVNQGAGMGTALYTENAAVLLGDGSRDDTMVKMKIVEWGTTGVNMECQTDPVVIDDAAEEEWEWMLDPNKKELELARQAERSHGLEAALVAASMGMEAALRSSGELTETEIMETLIGLDAGPTAKSTFLQTGLQMEQKLREMGCYSEMDLSAGLDALSPDAHETKLDGMPVEKSRPPGLKPAWVTDPHTGAWLQAWVRDPTHPSVKIHISHDNRAA